MARNAFKDGMTSMLFLLCALSSAGAQETQTPLPIIDVHMHAYFAGHAIGGPRERDLAPTAPGEFWGGVLDGMEQHNVVLALTSGALRDVDAWREALPDVVLAGTMFPCPSGAPPGSGMPCYEANEVWPDIDWLRSQYQEGRLAVMGEVTGVYAGVSPGDARFDPYFALADELDIPVGFHTGAGPLIRGPECHCPAWNGKAGNPALLRPVLQRYPKLRLYLMHAGLPGFLDETLSLMQDYPNVYADLAAVIIAFPREEIYGVLRKFMEANLEGQLLFGSDSIFSLGLSKVVIEDAAFLTLDQKRAIFYDNASRFLRLTEEQIDIHHGRKP